MARKKRYTARREIRLMSDENEIVQEAIDALNLEISEWARPILVAAAKKVLAAQKRPVDLPKPSEVAHAETTSPLPSGEDKPRSK